MTEYYEWYIPLPYGWRIRLSGYLTSWRDWCLSVAIQGPPEREGNYDMRLTHELTLMADWTNEGEWHTKRPRHHV